CRKPLAGSDVLLHLRVVLREILLHQAISIRAGPVKYIMRILLHVVEVDAHGLQQILANRLRKLPSPLRIEVSVRYDVQSGSLVNIRSGHRLAAESWREGK